MTSKSNQQEYVEKLLGCDTLKDETKINTLGRVLAWIPLKPNLAKMLILGNKAKKIEYSILVASLLTVEELFYFPSI